MTGAMAWIGRLIFLVLSMLASLSIIGSIAAIPSGIAEQRFGIERGRPTLPDEPSADRQVAYRPAAGLPAASPPSRPATEQPDGGASRAAQTAAVPAPPERDDPLLWLEPLTYAALALAGLAAIAVLLLWRAVAALEAHRR